METNYWFSSGESGGGSGYQIGRSLRFNSADSAYLDRTPSSAGNRRTWTWSGWVKLSKTRFNEQNICGWQRELGWRAANWSLFSI